MASLFSHVSIELNRTITEQKKSDDENFISDDKTNHRAKKPV